MKQTNHLSFLFSLVISMHCKGISVIQKVATLSVSFNCMMQRSTQLTGTPVGHSSGIRSKSGGTPQDLLGCPFIFYSLQRIMKCLHFWHHGSLGPLLLLVTKILLFHSIYDSCPLSHSQIKATVYFLANCSQVKWDVYWDPRGQN